MLLDTLEGSARSPVLQTVATIGYLADHGALLTGSGQRRGGAVEWLAPFLAEDQEASHG